MKRRKTLAILLASLSILSLSACTSADKPDGSRPSSESQQTQEEVTHDITEDSYKAQLEYYMETVEALQDELLASKEALYVMETEHKLKVEELEKSIAALKDGLKDADTDKDSTQNTPTVNPSQKDPTELDNLSQSVGGKNEVTDKEPEKEPEEDSDKQKSYFEYRISDGAVTIVSFVGDGDSVSVPETIGGYPVRYIGEGAFKDAKIKSIKLPEGILKIDWFAFEGCTELKSITLPSSVTSIGYGTFDRCPSDVIIICKKGSYAEAYAASWGMLYLAE